jgi:hypothetical protein
MELPSLPADLAIVIAGLAAIVSHWLQDDGLSARINGLIALASRIVSAVATVFLTSGFSGNLKDDTLLLIATAFALAVKESFALLGYIRDAASPLAPAQVSARASVKPTVKSWPSDGE